MQNWRKLSVEQSNSYTIEFLVDAINDMSEIISSFVMLGSKQGAVRIKNKMNKAVQQISDFPYLGVTIPDDKLAKFDFRMIVVEKYLMFYRIFEDEHKVIFYRVLNDARNYPTLLNRFAEEVK
ncbi:MAG: type II toxin-antitoxin system RelE/ParE family toxin [Ruminococcus sp.]|nr:type II toxin-antitoxin system RelE/ParE family toxin [Ruminococcus sp.]